MTRTSIHMPGWRRLLIVAAMIAAGAVSTAQSALTTYMADLDGVSQSPPNASPGIGVAQVDLDDVAHTMHLTVVFEGLLGTTTASHIHAATALPGEGTAGVATTLPTFTGFPLGVTSGSYEVTLDMTDPSSYNPSFVTAHGGTTAGAEAFLFQSIADGTAYLNVHTSSFAGGEIRGFFVLTSVPVTEATWGGIKSLYR
jgi:hypothetical protein